MTSSTPKPWNGNGGLAWQLISRGGIAAILLLVLLGVYSLANRGIDVLERHLERQSAAADRMATATERIAKALEGVELVRRDR